MTLDQARKGQSIIIRDINDEQIKVQSIRLGLYEGARVSCSGKIPFGPVIVSNRMQEIAIGRELAKRIAVDIDENRSGR